MVIIKGKLNKPYLALGANLNLQEAQLTQAQLRAVFAKGKAARGEIKGGETIPPQEIGSKEISVLTTPKKARIFSYPIKIFGASKKIAKSAVTRFPKAVGSVIGTAKGFIKTRSKIRLVKGMVKKPVLNVQEAALSREQLRAIFAKSKEGRKLIKHMGRRIEKLSDKQIKALVGRGSVRQLATELGISREAIASGAGKYAGGAARMFGEAAKMRAIYKVPMPSPKTMVKEYGRAVASDIVDKQGRRIAGLVASGSEPSLTLSRRAIRRLEKGKSIKDKRMIRGTGSAFLRSFSGGE